MIGVIYYERAVADHARTKQLFARFPHAVRVSCDRYGEVFNRGAQHFRLQKKRPSLILAHKHDNFVLAAPTGYGIGSPHNFYFSHLLNCLYDCRYCFLQGMFRSAHYLLFVNYDDFQDAIDRQIAETPNATFFSGYDCDSLALDQITGFTESFLPYFARREPATLELRTKSVNVKSLLSRQPLTNCVVAFSLTPPPIAADLEHGAPKVEHRIAVMERLAAHGWRLGLRIDPLIYHPDYQAHYDDLFTKIFSVLPQQALHSVSFGSFRLPKAFFGRMQRLYPDEPLFAGPLAQHGKMVGYQAELERAMLEFCRQRLQRYMPAEKLFPCDYRQQHR